MSITLLVNVWAHIGLIFYWPTSRADGRSLFSIRKKGN